MPPATLSTGEVAKMLGVTRQCIRQWCEFGKIASTKDEFGCYRIPEDVAIERAKKANRKPGRRLISVREAAQMLSLSPDDIERLCKQRHLGSIRLPGCPLRIEASEIERLLKHSASPAITTGRI